MKAPVRSGGQTRPAPREDTSAVIMGNIGLPLLSLSSPSALVTGGSAVTSIQGRPGPQTLFAHRGVHASARDSRRGRSGRGPGGGGPDGVDGPRRRGRRCGRGRRSDPRPTVAWPVTRKELTAGRQELATPAEDQEHRDGQRFDPRCVTAGIELSRCEGTQARAVFRRPPPEPSGISGSPRSPAPHVTVFRGCVRRRGR